MAQREQEIAWLKKEKYTAESDPALLAHDIKRLEQGEPLAYVIGWVDFLGTHIDLSRRPLIPRPETEWWTELLIDDIRETKPNAKILDLCSGSGCIGIALLRHLPNITVEFAEIDPILLEQIKTNLSTNNIDVARTKIIQSDLFDSVATTDFDVIAVNPPYIDPTRIGSVENSVLHYEPSRALFAHDGITLITKIIEQGKNFLKNDGVMMIEFGEGQEETLLEYAEQMGWGAEILNDLYDRPRVLRTTKNHR